MLLQQPVAETGAPLCRQKEPLDGRFCISMESLGGGQRLLLLPIVVSVSSRRSQLSRWSAGKWFARREASGPETRVSQAAPLIGGSAELIPLTKSGGQDLI